MAQLVDITGVQRKLQELAKEHLAAGSPRVSVIVGYTANYAIHVHENVEMKWKGRKRHKPKKGRYWDPQGRGQSKFLEQPAREMANELGGIARKAVMRGASLLQAIAIAGLRLQRASQKLVPVDTGNLKGSAFTRKE